MERNFTAEKRAIELRSLNEYAYCKRLFHFMYVEGIFIDNDDTEAGTDAHEKASKRGGQIRRIQNKPAESELLAEITVNAAENENLDSLPELNDNPPKNLKFGDEQKKIVGVLDAIEQRDGRWIPVESKKSASPDSENPVFWEDYELQPGAWYNDQLQLAGQIYLLRMNGYVCDSGILYYRGNRRRVEIKWNDQYERILNEIISRIENHNIHKRPKPLINSPKCVRCSLVEICLPDEENSLINKQPTIRKVIPGRSDGGMIYVTGYTARLSVSGEELVITEKNEKIRIPFRDIAGIRMFGNSQITTQAVSTLLDAGIRIGYHSSAGRLKGIAAPFNSVNAHLRKLQVLQSKETALGIARKIIAAKILNQRILIRRNSSLALESELKQLNDLANKAASVDSEESLLGIEGSAARIYYQVFPSMIKKDLPEFDFRGRSRRPPKDPVNALLSFTYTLLLNDIVNACMNVGLDPMIGFFHSDEKGRPSLALDLMEPYRPIVADSSVLRAINTGMVSESDFEITNAGTVMKKQAKRGIIKSYEQRVDQLIRHPMFGYHMSYRRIFEIEVRLFGRYLEGELQSWEPMVVR